MATGEELGPEDEGAEWAYKAWKRSESRGAAHRARLVEEIFAVAFVSVGVPLTWTSIKRSPMGTYSVHAVPLTAGAVCILFSLGLGVFLAWRYASIKRDYLLDVRRELVYRAIEDIEPEDVQRLILLNQRRMDQYHQMTLSQAATAWRSSQLAMGIGLAVIVGGVAVALVPSDSGATQAVVGSLAGVGSAFSGYIATTFLQARRQSLSQLNYYFRQPLTTSYLLTAERLVAKGGATETAQKARNELAAVIVGRAFSPPDGPAQDE